MINIKIKGSTPANKSYTITHKVLAGFIITDFEFIDS